MSEKLQGDDSSFDPKKGNTDPKPQENRNGQFLVNLAQLAGETAVGLGVGISAGIGVMAAISAAEIVIPAALIFNALGLTGGAIGFLAGTRKLK